MGPLPLPDTRYLKQRRGQRRSGSRWYVRIAVPHDLRDQFGAQHIERSLDTGDLKEAQKRRHGALAEIFADFEKARRGALTSGDIEQEAQLFLQVRFKALQKRSDDICAPDQDALGNEMQPLAERALFELHAMQQEEDWPPLIEQTAENIAKQYGATLGPSQREELCRALLHAEIEAHTRALGAHNGEILKPVSVLNARAIDPITAEVARPKRPSPKKGTALRVSEAAVAYVADRNREKQSSWTGQTRNQAETTFRLFADATSDAQIDTITRRDVADQALSPMATGRRKLKSCEGHSILSQPENYANMPDVRALERPPLGFSNAPPQNPPWLWNRLSLIVALLWRRPLVGPALCLVGMAPLKGRAIPKQTGHGLGGARLERFFAGFPSPSAVATVNKFGVIAGCRR